MPRYTGLSQGYVVYPSNTGYMGLVAAKKAAMKEARLHGFSRVESIDTQKTIISYRSKAKNPSKSSKWFKALAARILPNGAVQVRVPRGARAAVAGRRRNPNSLEGLNKYLVLQGCWS